MRQRVLCVVIRAQSHATGSNATRTSNIVSVLFTTTHYNYMNPTNLEVKV